MNKNMEIERIKKQIERYKRNQKGAMCQQLNIELQKLLKQQ
jgi:hypothetical protein